MEAKASTSLQQTSKDKSLQAAESVPHTRLTGNRLLAARIVWATITVWCIVLFFMAITPYYDQFTGFNYIREGATRQTILNSMLQLGLSTDFFSGWATVWVLFRTLCFFVVAFLIIKARSDDWMAMFVSLFLITFAVGRVIDNLSRYQGWDLPSTLVTAIAYCSFPLFLYIFPNGRFVPRWTMWIQVVVLLVVIPSTLFSSFPYSLNRWPWFVYDFLIIGVLMTGAYAQIHRYRHVANRIEQQQIKWIMFGSLAVVIGSLIYSVPLALYPSLSLHDVPGIPSLLHEILTLPIIIISMVMIPISIGIAVLRYHLWNIDMIINRTLVYLPLTAIIAGMYSTLIVLFQRLFMAMTGERSDAAVVITTLILATTFTPLKNGLQNIVDKRFKEGSESTKKLEAFAKELVKSPYVISPTNAARRLLEESISAFDASGGAVYLSQDGSLQPVHSTDDWQDEYARMSIPIGSEGQRHGMLYLGRCEHKPDYTERERKTMQKVADMVAGVIEQA